MQFKVYYSQTQLDATINYIATHNPSMLGKIDKIRAGILDGIQELVQRYPDLLWISRNGWYVWADMIEREGIDSDENELNIEFMVNPSFDAEEYISDYYYKKLP
jgi:hypothetical protein